MAELALDGKKGAVVALDPRDGSVLAMVSRPAFDPNLFAGHISTADWKALTTNPDNPLLNRAIQAQFAPGSTFKPLVAMAGLETGTIDDNFSVRCSGGANFYGRFFKCWQKGGHGGVNVHAGIVHSCDVFFYTVGNKLGHRQYRRIRGAGGSRQENRHRSSRRSRGIDAVHQMETSDPAREMVRGRNDLGRDWPRRRYGHSASACQRHRRDGERGRLV